MTEEVWNPCENGTLDKIASTQRNRISRRLWQARLLAAVLILAVPSIGLISFFKAYSIECQQAIVWFDSANSGKLTSSENLSFQLHLLTCGKCRYIYSRFQQDKLTSAQVRIEFQNQDCKSASCTCLACANRSSHHDELKHVSLVSNENGPMKLEPISVN